MNKRVKNIMSITICTCIARFDISYAAMTSTYQNYNSVYYYERVNIDKDKKSDSKTNWWWLLLPVVPITIFGGRYLIENYRSNSRNHSEYPSTYDNLDLKLEENDIKTLQTMSKLIYSCDYWQAVVQKLNLNNSYCNQNFYDSIVKLCCNLYNLEELYKTFKNLKPNDKKLIVFFLKDENCIQKINRFIAQLESELKSRKEKINSSNTRNYYNYRYSDRMYNKQKTVNILGSVSSEDFIKNAYSQI